MEAVIISVILFVAVLLILVILAQNSKGGGLSSQFGGSGASSMIGVKKTSDLLEKLTWGLAITMLALTLVVNIVDGPSTSDPLLDRIQQEEQNQLPSLDIDPSLLNGAEGTESQGEGDLLQQLESTSDSSN